MKLRTCPVCKLRIPARSKSCPVCDYEYTKFEYFRMNYLRYVIIGIIILYTIYNIVTIMLMNNQIRDYLHDTPEDDTVIVNLEKKYNSLNPIQKYFVHYSEISYLKEHAGDDLTAVSVYEEKVTIYFDSGSIEGTYTGKLIKDQPIENGSFTYVDDKGMNCVYEGYFSDNTFSGEGTLTKENGEVYSGTFSYGKLNGVGEYYNENGELIYKGMFVNNIWSGDGTMYTPDGYVIYRGNFTNGRPSVNEYRSVCTNVSPAQLYNFNSDYARTNVALTGVVSDILKLEDDTVQYVLSSQTYGRNNVCVKFWGRATSINIGDTVTMYGYCGEQDDYYIESGERRNGIILTAFYVAFVAKAPPKQN